jgi:hypothetical protein
MTFSDQLVFNTLKTTNKTEKPNKDKKKKRAIRKQRTLSDVVKDLLVFI